MKHVKYFLVGLITLVGIAAAVLGVGYLVCNYFPYIFGAFIGTGILCWIYTIGENMCG